jgi:predicted phage terminase large subunit-like protein
MHAFVDLFWRDSGETSEFCDNWHLHMLAAVLEEHAHKRMRDTVINVPPGTGKTLWIQVFWPAFVWALIDPKRCFIFTSYDRDKLHQIARQFLRLIRSPLYQAMFPDVRCERTSPAEAEIRNTKGGVRLAYQMGGAVTGHHGDHIVCDDADKADETSPDQLSKTVENWQMTFSTRLLPGGSRLIIMQRINYDDLAGYMLRLPAKHRYEHVCYPMRYVPNCPWDMGCSLGNLDIRTQAGELLWEERYSEEKVSALEVALGTAQNASAQLQQNPVPEKGNYFEAAWFGTWALPLPRVNDMLVVQSWDLGFKGRTGKGTADSWVHGALWAKVGSEYWLLDEVRVHDNYAGTKKLFLSMQSRPLWKNAAKILLEDKANGPALESEVRDLVKIPIQMINPDTSKVDRARRHSAKAEAGWIKLPPVEEMPTVAEFLAEIVRFPNQKANDRVDTMTQALDYLADGAMVDWREVLENM